MALSKERLAEIGLTVLKHKFENEGLSFKPKEIKREIVNGAKKLKIPAEEFAEFTKVVLSEIHEKNINELEKIISGKVED